MRIPGFSRKQPKPVIPPELQPYYADRYGSRRRAMLWTLGLLLIFICLGVLLWLATHDWSFTGETAPTPPTTKSSPAVQPPQNNKVLDQNTNKPATTPLSGQTTEKPAP